MVCDESGPVIYLCNSDKVCTHVSVIQMTNMLRIALLHTDSDLGLHLWLNKWYTNCRVALMSMRMIDVISTVFLCWLLTICLVHVHITVALLAFGEYVLRTICFVVYLLYAIFLTLGPMPFAKILLPVISTVIVCATRSFVK